MVYVSNSYSSIPVQPMGYCTWFPERWSTPIKYGCQIMHFWGTRMGLSTTMLSSHLEDQETRLVEGILTDIQNNDGWMFYAVNQKLG